MSGSAGSETHWWSEFEATSVEVGDWLWGTVQGAFNEKATLSQIIVDAVIGMIPLVGDVTAVRDLIAVSIGMVDEPAKRDDKMQWLMLVVLVLALIPVAGGVIKGVGRLTIKAIAEAAHLVGAARAARLGQAAKDIIAFLNRIGVGHAERWLLRLRFADHQAAILEKFNSFIVTIRRALAKIKSRMSAILPDALLHRIDALFAGLERLRQKGAQMIPDAIKELDQNLREIQAYIRAGGETTARTVEHTVATGTRSVTYADELRLIDKQTGAVRSSKGGWAQNSSNPNRVAEVYHYEPGYPDMRKFADGKSGQLTGIPAYAGKIVNRTMKPGEEVFRLFGPEGITHGEKIGMAYSPGAWWGLGAPPTTAKAWRENAAVLDEFNRDGFMVVGQVIEPDRIKACVGKISEQRGKKIPGQYLPGGGMQGIFFLDDGAKAALNEAGLRVIASGKAETITVGGMRFAIRPTNWKDANGVWGYIHAPGASTVQTARLGSRELAAKDEDLPATRTRKAR